MNEAVLTFANFEKQLNDKNRGDLFIEELKKGHLKLNDGEYVDIKNATEIIHKISDVNGKFDPERAYKLFVKNKRYVPVFDTDEGLLTLNRFEKTPELGGGKGSSLGSKDTRIIETIQCFFFTIKEYSIQNSINITTKSDYMNAFYKNSGLFEYCHSKVKSKNNIESPDTLFLEYTDWTDSFINVSNGLFKTEHIFGSHKDFTLLSPDKEYIYYQVSYSGNIVNKIQKKYYSFSGAFNHKINFSKWNPSDIWCVNVHLLNKMESELDLVEDLEDLNEFINKYFDSNDLVGISLKKIINNRIPTYIVNSITERPHYTFKDIKISEDITSTSVKIYAVTDKGHQDSITFRRFTTEGSRIIGNVKEVGLSNICGEVDGYGARQGKISFKALNHIIHKYIGGDPEPIKDYDFLSKHRSKDDLAKDIYKMMFKLGTSVRELKLKYLDKKHEDDYARMISKYQGLILLNIFKYKLSNDHTKRDACIEEIMYYALSIKTDHFESPRYVRIIDRKV